MNRETRGFKARPDRPGMAPAGIITNQSGSSLLLGLLFIAVLSLGVTTAFSDNRWQLKMTSNQWSEDRALQAANSALNWGESWLMSQPGDIQLTDNSPGNFLPGEPLAREALHQDEAWWLDHGISDGIEPLSGELLQSRQVPGSPRARWLVEAVHHTAADAQAGTPAISYYRIIARAPRVPRGSPVVLEVIMARPWGSPEWTDQLPFQGMRFCSQPESPDHCGRLSWRRVQ